MHIGEIAEEACVSPSILRYYEAIGLIPRPGRDACGYRSYTDAEIERIWLVVGARSVGLSLPDIREILRMQDEGEAPCQRLLDLLEYKAGEVRRRMNHLKGLEDRLRRLHDLGRALYAEAVEAEEAAVT